jgi:benzoate-CoA ligase family protein
MTPNTVRVDRSVAPAKIEYSASFNVAGPLIDRHAAEGRSARVAIRTASEAVTYGEVAERANRTGNLLRGAGLIPGDRMVMVVKDCPEFFYLFWGAVKAGVVPIPVNTLLRAADYRYMIEDSGAAGLAFSPEFAAEAEPALRDAAHRPSLVLRTHGEDGLARRIAAVPTSLAPHPARAADDCFWLYSSGSTGRPKGAVHAQRDIVATCVYYGEGILNLRPDDVVFSAAKLFFAYGFGNAMTFPLWAGATAVLSDQRPSPDMTFDVIERFKPTVYFGVPTLYAAQLRALEAGGRDLASVRLCVSAGEALPADIFRRWRERTGLAILDGIGSTEGLHIFISNTQRDCRAGTSGRVMPGYDAKIVGDDGQPVARGETGRLMVKGDSCAKYYWNQPEKTRDTMVGDGWLNTGDTYTQDADGYYVYCGRSDDMIKVGGIWCSPIEIEARLIEHPKVLEAAVVGRADDDGLVKPAAYVILKDAGDACAALEAELLDHCKSGLARYKYPRWFAFVPELPKTATGKIQRFKLRQG